MPFDDLTMADGSAHMARAGPGRVGSGRGAGAGRPGARVIRLRGRCGVVCAFDHVAG